VRVYMLQLQNLTRDAADCAFVWPMQSQGTVPYVGSGVDRIRLLHFLARCHIRRLNQALPSCLILGFV